MIVLRLMSSFFPICNNCARTNLNPMTIAPNSMNIELGYVRQGVITTIFIIAPKNCQFAKATLYCPN